MERYVMIIIVILGLTMVYQVIGLSGPHIADLNILLPPKMTNFVEYRLQGTGGCFKWSWDHHDILSVVPEYNSSNRCSTSARLRSILPYSGRKETAVYATDMHSGMLIRCKVYIDNFSRIQIFHSSIKLDLDGLATLRVRAFDAEDNVFSSLVGLQFMWKLISKANGLPNHLVHVPLKDSPLSDCGGLCGDLDIQTALEDTDVFSDLYVVQGVGIGHQTVSVHLHEPQLEHMADNIVLTVAEAMFLDPPSPVLVLIGAIVHYTLKIIRGNIPQAVTLPSSYHQWSSSNSSVAQVDSVMGFANALNLGVSSVIVEDTRVAGHLQISSLHVVLPDTIHLYLLPLSQTGEAIDGMDPIPSMPCWYIVSGRNYLVLLKVYARGPGAHEIYITETDHVKLHDDQSGYWNILPLADNAFKHGFINSRILEATSYGLGKLFASLTYSTGDGASREVLKVVEEVMVCNQVRFIMDYQNLSTKSILLPWAPTIYQELDLKATGGCAKASTDYKWFSSDMAIVSVSAYGVVLAKKPGIATIKVVSIFDPLNYDEVVIEVSIPSSLVMLPNFPVETTVGSHLQAAVTMKSSNGAYFDRCDAFSSFVKWKAGSESFKILNVTRQSLPHDMHYGLPCAWTNVYASGSGFTMLNAMLSEEYYPFDHSLTKAIVLKASSRIAAYTPLVIYQAGDGNQFGGYWFDVAQSKPSDTFENLDELYLVPGSYLDVNLHGGPEPWSKGVQFIESFEVLSKEKSSLRNGAVAHQLSTSHTSSYRISCNHLGEYIIVFKRGNSIGDDHPLPSFAEAHLMLRCSIPSALVLIADEAVNRHDVILRSAEASRTPDRVHVNPVNVANGRTIRISSVGISTSGKAFGNSSSLMLNWELINCNNLASWDNAYDFGTFKSSWERFLVLHDVSGLCIVRASVIGFAGNVDVDHSTLSFETLESNLTDAVHLQLVSTLRVEPEFSLLFFSPDAQLNLSIIGGSCSLDTVVNDSEVVQVIQPPLSSLQCSQLTMIPKGLGTTLITVYDIGISPPLDATSTVQVSDLDWIRITSPEELSIMEGSLQLIDLLVGIDGGYTFDVSQYIYMGIQVHIEDRTVELAESDDVASPINGFVKGPNFTIRARNIGITTLYVSARQHSGREILSQPIKVEVYAMPRLHPSDIFLVPGASYVLTLRGGPTIGAHVEYGSMDVETAIVHISSGHLSAVSPGNTTVVAIVYGHGDTVICQAISQVKVGIPSSAMLITQSDQLAFNYEMPIFPSFFEGNLFSLYELCKNYKWVIKNKKVLNFQNRGSLPDVKNAGSMFYGDENDLSFVEVIHGKSAGMTEVTVSFSCDFNYSGTFHQSMNYIASTTISVIPELPLALGASMTWTLPPYHTSSNLLPMSSSPYNHKGAVSYSLLTQCGRKNEEVQKDAISLEGDRIRTAESNNTICIQAKDRSSGRIQIAACVRVAEVSQIRINNKNIRRVDLAIGAEIGLPINYYDVLGIPFLEAYDVPFDADINYPDIVHMNVNTDGNGSIHLKAMHHGRALLRLSFGNNERKSDYMLITVGAQVYPQNPVLERGSRLNFSVEGSHDQVFGQWLTGNESVISVDMITGKSKALEEGIAQVVFESSSLKLQTTVTVQNSGSIVVDAPKEKLTNVPYPIHGYRFAVNFRNTHDHKYEDPQNSVQVPYDCSVDPPFIGYTTPWSDLETGKLYCLFFPYTPDYLARVVPKSKDMTKDIYVSIKASVANQISGSASAVFIGGFVILDMDKKPMQLNLTEDYFIHNLTIVGNPDVVVKWEKHDRLTIKLIERDDFGISARAVYEFKVLGALNRSWMNPIGSAMNFKDKVIFTRLATGQIEEISFEFQPHYSVSWHIKSLLWFCFWGGVFSWVCVIFFRICLRKHTNWPPRNEATRTNPFPVTPPTPGFTTPNTSTPVRGSPSIMEERPYRTPPPFMEYVMRTIDETPNYYRGEARRRRVDPPNSM